MKWNVPPASTTGFHSWAMPVTLVTSTFAPLTLLEPITSHPRVVLVMSGAIRKFPVGGLTPLSELRKSHFWDDVVSHAASCSADPVTAGLAEVPMHQVSPG